VSGDLVIVNGAVHTVDPAVPRARAVAIVGGRIAGSSGMFFWVWTLITIGITGFFSVVLSVRGLWNLRRGKTE